MFIGSVCNVWHFDWRWVADCGHFLLIVDRLLLVAHQLPHDRTFEQLLHLKAVSVDGTLELVIVEPVILNGPESEFNSFVVAERSSRP